MRGARTVIVGPSGSGKSTLGQALAKRTGAAHLELDALMHLPGWKPRPTAEMAQEIERFTDRHPRWVVDGNYAAFRALLWGKADRVVWLDLARHVVIGALLRRTLRRVVTRTELWNGNRETWRDVLSLDPERSVLVAGWTRFAGYRRDYGLLSQDPAWRHLDWVRLTSRSEVQAFVERAGAEAAARG